MDASNGGPPHLTIPTGQRSSGGSPQHTPSPGSKYYVFIITQDETSTSQNGLLTSKIVGDWGLVTNHVL